MEDGKGSRRDAAGWPGLSLVALKGYGDLAIALTSLARLPADRRGGFGLLLAEHLRPLFEAAALPVAMRTIANREPELPAVFNVKRRGYWRAIVSARDLRSSLRRAAGALGTTYLFDRIGARERFIAGRGATMALPPAPNIYLGYEALFDRLGLRPAAPAAAPPAGARLRVFPGSRVAAKAFPRALVEAVFAIAAAAGIAAELMLLDGESPQLEACDVPIRRVPRDFAAMLAAVRDSDFVVSADSLPAHLAEFAGRPVFVFSPVPNRFWLPRSAYDDDNWALFDEGAALGKFLARVPRPSPWTETRRAATSS